MGLYHRYQHLVDRVSIQGEAKAVPTLEETRIAFFFVLIITDVIRGKKCFNYSFLVNRNMASVPCSKMMNGTTILFHALPFPVKETMIYCVFYSMTSSMPLGTWSHKTKIGIAVE